MMDCHFPAIRAHFAPWTSTRRRPLFEWRSRVPRVRVPRDKIKNEKFNYGRHGPLQPKSTIPHLKNAKNTWSPWCLRKISTKTQKNPQSSILRVPKTWKISTNISAWSAQFYISNLFNSFKIWDLKKLLLHYPSKEGEIAYGVCDGGDAEKVNMGTWSREI